MIRSIIIMIVLGFGVSAVHAETSPLVSYSLQDIDSLQQTGKRNLVVFVYTDWCRYCKAMEQTTFRNSKVVQLLNEQYYFSKLNAEGKQAIVFNGSRFNYKPTGVGTGVHELANYLATIDGQVNYPSLCILNPSNEVVYRTSGFLSAKDLLKILEATIDEK